MSQRLDKYIYMLIFDNVGYFNKIKVHTINFATLQFKEGHFFEDAHFNVTKEVSHSILIAFVYSPNRRLTS